MRTVLHKIFPFLLILAVFVSCKESTTDPTDKYTNIIAGTIIDEQEIGVPDAEVSAFLGQTLLNTTTTNEDGGFELKSLPENIEQVDVVVKHLDFQEFHGKLSNFVDGSKKKAKVRILHNDSCCGKIQVWVKNSSDSSYINDVEVRLNKGKQVLKKAYTGNDGYLEFTNVCPGKYWIRVFKENFKVQEIEFAIGDCDSAQFHLYLEEVKKDTCCKGIIKVYVKDENGNPIKETKVRLWKGQDKIREVFTDDDGYVIMDGICEGNYQISLLKDGYKGQEFAFEMGCNDNKEFTKTMLKQDCCNGKVKIIPKDKEIGDILNGANVKLRKDGAIIGEKKVENGFALFEKLCKGNYVVNITKDGYTALEFKFELGCDETKELDKMMEKVKKDSCCKGIIKVFVRDDDNKALSSVKVMLRKNGELVEKIISNADGIAIFDGICEGKYQIDLQKEGYKAMEFMVEIGCDETVEVEKKMTIDTCCTASFKVLVKDIDSEEYLEGAIVKIYLNGKAIRDGQTNSDGWVVFKELCAPVNYVFVIEKDGYNSAEFEIKLTACKEYKEHFRIKKK